MKSAILSFALKPAVLFGCFPEERTCHKQFRVMLLVFARKTLETRHETNLNAESLRCNSAHGCTRTFSKAETIVLIEHGLVLFSQALLWRPPSRRGEQNLSVSHHSHVHRLVAALSAAFMDED